MSPPRFGPGSSSARIIGLALVVVKGILRKSHSYSSSYSDSADLRTADDEYEYDDEHDFYRL